MLKGKCSGPRRTAPSGSVSLGRDPQYLHCRSHMQLRGHPSPWTQDACPEQQPSGLSLWESPVHTRPALAKAFQPILLPNSFLERSVTFPVSALTKGREGSG